MKINIIFESNELNLERKKILTEKIFKLIKEFKTKEKLEYYNCKIGELEKGHLKILK